RDGSGRHLVADGYTRLRPHAFTRDGDAGQQVCSCDDDIVVHMQANGGVRIGVHRSRSIGSSCADGRTLLIAPCMHNAFLNRMAARPRPDNGADVYRGIRRRSMKGLLYAGIAALGVVLMPVGEAAAQNLRFGHANTPGEIAAALFDEFAARVKERTDGQGSLQVSRGGQLRERGEPVQQGRDGALAISAPSMAAASTLVPALEIPSTPFLWTDWREAETVISGPAMQPVFDELEKS